MSQPSQAEVVLCAHKFMYINGRSCCVGAGRETEPHMYFALNDHYAWRQHVLPLLNPGLGYIDEQQP